MERRNIAVPKAHGGEAVARILHDGLGVPHSTAKGLIDAGCVTINGRPVRSHGQRCEGGDVVEVRFDPERRYEPRPPLRHGPGFRVVHEDLEIVVVDKTPGLLSSPAPGRRDESLAELIAESLRSRGIKKPQLFVVHRLDQHTSGLLAFARTPRAMEWMAAQFESREAGRAYTAVVSGRVARERGTIQSWLVEDARSLSVHTTPTRGAGKRAITHFAVQERFEDATLVRVGLETGRKHQIRVHFAEIGHSVLGDRRYGEPSSVLLRVALHADRLTFRHPRTLEKMTFEAPLPEDLTKLVARLRRGSVHAEGGETIVEAPETPAVRPRAAAGTAFRVAVFPQGLTLTDPMGPTASHLMDPIVDGTVGAPASRGRAGAAHAPGPRGSALRGDRSRTVSAPPSREARPASDGFARRERLLRERSVGSRPPQRRVPAAGAPSTRPEGEPRRSRGSEAARPVSGMPRDAKPWRGKSQDSKPWSGKPREAKSWSGKPREAKPSSGRGEYVNPVSGTPRDAKTWRGKSQGSKPWNGKPREAKAWSRKPREAKPSSGSREDVNPASGKPRDAKPWRGKSQDSKPWSGKPRETKPWSGKKEDVNPASGRPRDAKPWRGKSQDSKPWSGKPREAKPWSAKREDVNPASGRPRDAKPWRGKSQNSKLWSGKPRETKPWSGRREDVNPASGKSHDAKPWSGKREDFGPGSGKPHDAKPWRGKRQDTKPWSGKPRETKPWSGKSRDSKPWSGKPRETKPWSVKPPVRGNPPAKGAAQHAASDAPGKTRPADRTGEAHKPWEFSQKGSTLRHERRRKISAAQAKGLGKGKKR